MRDKVWFDFSRGKTPYFSLTLPDADLPPARPRPQPGVSHADHRSHQRTRKAAWQAQQTVRRSCRHTMSRALQHSLSFARHRPFTNNTLRSLVFGFVCRLMCYQGAGHELSLSCLTQSLARRPSAMPCSAFVLPRFCWKEDAANCPQIVRLLDHFWSIPNICLVDGQWHMICACLKHAAPIMPVRHCSLGCSLTCSLRRSLRCSHMLSHMLSQMLSCMSSPHAQRFRIFFLAQSPPRFPCRLQREICQGI